MKYRIKNTTHRGKAFKVVGGMAVVGAGKTEAVDCKHEMSDEKIAELALTGVHIKKATSAPRKAES